MTSTTTAMRVHRPGAELQPDLIAVTPPTEHQVRIAVIASGVCGADLGTASGPSHDGQPATPGHEIAGVIAEIGSGVTDWQLGDRVAVGWFGGSCGRCSYCRRGDQVHCPQRQVPGVSYPGGWAGSVTVPVDALVRVPDELDLFEAAPMGCAGVTAFNAVRHSNVPPGGRIAVFGLGGVGHLTVQFAAAMGREVIAIARGSHRAEMAHNLGAHHYVDSIATPAGTALSKIGGVDAIIVTAPASEPIPELVRGLRPHGRLTLVGIGHDDVTVPVAPLVMNALTVAGHLTGSPDDIAEAMAFALLTGVRPVVERMPLERAAEAVARLRNGSARFRSVLDSRTDQPHMPAETPRGITHHDRS